MKKVLFVTSEAHPLIKTGGLADVSGSLPKALAELSQDIRLVMPKYQGLKTDEEIHYLCSLRIDNRDINIFQTFLPNSKVIVLLIDYLEFFGTPGNPYLDEEGNPWANSDERFALFCRAVVEIAMNRSGLNWKPDIVHCNDWQSGLVPALLGLEEQRPATIFTIHNLAYQGLFPASHFYALNLSGQLWGPGGVEFFGMMSFIKGGLACADRITTVSPSYAMEIQTTEFGYGLEGLLSHRQDVLSGIINGIDLEHWNPGADTHIAKNYSSSTLKDKQLNKIALQEQVSLPVNKDIPVIGLISRLVEQKGIDLIIDSLPEMITMPMQFILLGSGDNNYEQRLQNLAHLYPDRISITIGYNEQLSHLIEAGSDIFLMPSRFEPCGLNQMYSQRYGTLPLVRKTGGLADTVTDAMPHTIKNNTATGFVFNEPHADALLEAVKRALIMYDTPGTWKKMQRTAMARDFSWQHSAELYLDLYRSI